jgi:hypothetical protein
MIGCRLEDRDSYIDRYRDFYHLLYIQIGHNLKLTTQHPSRPDFCCALFYLAVSISD